MKMEIHKLQITQYAQSDFDNRSDASQNSFKKSDRFSDTTEIENKVRKISGYELPSEKSMPQSRNMSSGNTTQNSSNPQMNNSLVRAGRNLVHSESSMMDSPNGKIERKK